MSELVCGWCGVGSPAGSAECPACGARLEANAEKPPEAQVQQEPAAEPEAAAEPLEAESAVQPEAAAEAVEPVSAAQPEALAPPPDQRTPPADAPAKAVAEPAAPAPSGGTPAISDLVPCPNPGCFGVVAPGDAFCTFCGARLPAAPAASPAPPPSAPLPPPSSAGTQPSGGGFHIPRGVWIVLAILPLVTCSVIAAMVLNALGAPPGVFEPGAFPKVQQEAEAIAWPSGTPTRASTPTQTTTPSATPTATRTPGASAGPTGTITRVPTPSMTPDPGWKPPERTLAKGVSTVAVTADKLYTGVNLYNDVDRFAYQIMGRSVGCPTLRNGQGVLYRTYDGVPVWTDQEVFVNEVANPNNGYKIRADDPGLKAKQWVSYPCPQ